MRTSLRIDHIVLATPDLATTVADIAERLGVAPVPGGAHVGRGTYNALLGLGGHTYLEIIGPDPAQPDPDHPRPFGIDELERSRLVAWCVAPRRPLESVVADAIESGFDPGPIESMSRRRPDGVLLEWSLTFPPSGADSVLPFLIDWRDSPHPTTDLPIGGQLVGLDLVHSSPRRIDSILTSIADPATLGDDESVVTLNEGSEALVSARIRVASGTVALD
ncbi:MAG: VOC family protein [Actinomycetota bacterium]